MDWVWLEFTFTVAVIGYAGSRLCVYGDAIAESTGLGGTLVGVFLLAAVTSLPELIIGVSAVVLADAVDIAVGAILGSCVFNLVVIVILDFLLRGETVYTRLSRDHILSAAFGVIMVGVVGFNVSLGSNGHQIAVGHVGIYTPIIAVIYLIAVRALARYHGRSSISEPLVQAPPPHGIRWLAGRFLLASLAVVGTGAWLPFVGERLALAMGVHETFVGTLFMAFATSLPEVVVTLAAVRIGAIDMAVGNLFGSNLFNILVLVPEDLLYTKAPILGVVSPLHAISGMSAVIMTGIAIVGLLYRPQRRLMYGLSWASLFLLSIYLLNTYVVYLYGP